MFDLQDYDTKSAQRTLVIPGSKFGSPDQTPKHSNLPLRIKKFCLFRYRAGSDLADHDWLQVHVHAMSDPVYCKS